MDERQVQGAIVKGLKDVGWRLFKMVDGAAGKRPFDITGISFGGIGVAIEVKSELPRGGEAALPWGDFATHQKAWLIVYAEAGAYAIVAIHNRESNTVTLYKVTANVVGSDMPRKRLESVELKYNAIQNKYVPLSELPWK